MISILTETMAIAGILTETMPRLYGCSGSRGQKQYPTVRDRKNVGILEDFNPMEKNPMKAFETND